jgi:peptidoglycan biosynthesis protein MviN/MurJ (putative lipid II flippase)
MNPFRSRSIPPSVRALIGTSLGLLPGFLLPFALSWRLHAGRLTDAYFLSFAIATFVATILSTVLEVSMIPAAASHIQSGGSSITHLVRRTIRYALGIAALAYVPTAVVGAVIVNAQKTWTTPQKHLCVALILIFGIYILATAATSVLAGTLFALRQFFVPTASQCLRTLLPLSFILLTPRNAGGVILTASLFIVGEILRGLLLVRRLLAKVRTISGDGTPPPPSGLLKASTPLALSLLVAAAAPLTDKIVAAPLGTGSVTVIELAEKVFFVPLVAITSSIILVAGARWANLIRAQTVAVTHDFQRTLRRVLALAGATTVLVGAATTLATAASGHRVLGLDALQFRNLVLIFLAGLPGAAVINLGARLMTSSQRTRLLPLFGIFAFTVNLVADIVGARLIGVDGIALASTLVRSAGAGLYLWACIPLLRALAPDTRGVERPTPFLLR